MTFKKTFMKCIAICTTVILVITVCGCDDLGEYTDTDEYYASFGDVVLIDGNSRAEEDYSVEKYFYNKESREDFLEGEEGVYSGIDLGEYVYVAIPFNNDIEMDTIAMFLRSESDVAVYMNIFLTDYIPDEWKGIADLETDEKDEEDEEEPKEYDDPNPETRIGETIAHLKEGEWGSFLVDDFIVNGKSEKSIRINDGQYILIQIRNNSGVRIFDEVKQAYVDPQTGIELPTAKITMTNLLIRALEIEEDT